MSPEPALDLDLDALRAERLAKLPASYKMRFGGSVYDLPPESPAKLAFETARGNYEAGIDAVLGDEQSINFWKQRPSMADLMAFTDGLLELYRRELDTPTNGDAPAKRKSAKA